MQVEEVLQGEYRGVPYFANVHGYGQHPYEREKIQPWLCGYIQVPDQYYGVHYNDLSDVNRDVLELTFSGIRPGKDGWYIGMDTMHTYNRHYTIADVEEDLKRLIDYCLDNTWPGFDE